VRKRNDASRDAVLAAYTNWMMAWSDFISLGASQVIAAGEVRAIPADVLQPLISQMSRALRVCLVTCDPKPVVVIGHMQMTATNDVAPLLSNGASRQVWDEVVGRTTELERQLINEIRAT
jgi:hypothetical protein